MNKYNVPNSLYQKLTVYAKKHHYSESWINYSMANILKHFWEYEDEDKITIKILMLDGCDIRDLLDFCPEDTNINDANIFTTAFYTYYSDKDDLEQSLNLATNFWFHYLNHSVEYQTIIQTLLNNFEEKYNPYILEILRVYIRHDQKETLSDYHPEAIILLCDFIKRLSTIHDLNLDDKTSFSECFFELDNKFFNQLINQPDSIKYLNIVKLHQELSPRLYYHQGDLYLKPYKTRIIKFPKTAVN